MPTNLIMGTQTTSIRTSSVLFADGTVQSTAAQSTDPLHGVVVGLTPPAPGQVLTATSPTAADWETPSSGGPVTKTARVDMGTIASATPSLVTAFTWPTPFADNFYTITGSVEILETPPAAAATEIICIGSIQKQAARAGFNFVVCNASSGVHHVIAQFIAIHD